MEGFIDFNTLPAMIAGFIILWMILARYLFRPVIDLLDNRQEDIKSTYNAAAATRMEADRLKTQLDERLSTIETESRARVQQAIKDAQKAKDEILEEARTKAEEALKKGRDDLAREREKTLVSLREDVVNLSLSAAEKLIGESLDGSKHRKLVSDFVDRIGS
jgi:F-type H+-transporting ATPase subunit b